MVDEPSRRTVLGVAGATAASAFAGCSLNNPEVEGGHLYVENLRSTTFQISLTVTAGDEDYTEQELEYVAPDDYQIEPPGETETGTGTATES